MARKRGIKLQSNDEDFRISKEQRERHEKVARSAGLTLSGSAIACGATLEPYNPCGLDDVIDMVFGEDKDLCKRPLKDRLKRAQDGDDGSLVT